MSALGDEPNDEVPNDDTARAAKAAAILGGIFALVALSLYGTRAAGSVLVGAAIAVANLLTMRAIIRALVQAPPPEQSGEISGDEPARAPDPKGTGSRGGIAWGIFAAFKILILFGGVWILLTRNVVDPMPLVVGYGVLPLGIAASALWSSLGQKR
jgi:ATP synthase I chain